MKIFLIAAQNIILSTPVPKPFPVRICHLRFFIFIGDFRFLQRLHMKYQTSNQKLKKVTKLINDVQYQIPKNEKKDQQL